MNPRTTYRTTLPLLAIVISISFGCATTKTTNDTEDQTQGEERVAQGIAAIAGESAGWQDTITNEDVQNDANVHVEQLLRGRVAGVEVIEYPGGGFSVRIRGKSSIMGGTEPLYVVDGMPILNSNGTGLSWLNIRDVQKIEVLKDVSGTSLYGSRGANGVVLITTKRG